MQSIVITSVPFSCFYCSQLFIQLLAKFLGCLENGKGKAVECIPVFRPFHMVKK